MKYKKVLGIDIGGSGIKGAPVNTEDGLMLAPKLRIPTPEHATPHEVSLVIAKMVKHFRWNGPIGCGFPAVIQNGIARTAANVDEKWIGTDADNLFSKVTNLPVSVVNDADAAGMAEMKFGAGKGQKGTILLVTIGTGIGSVVFSNKMLVPNTELGHIEMLGMDAEQYASDSARKRDQLSWEEWAIRFNNYLNRLEALIWPDLIILGGGASKKDEKFLEHIHVNAEIVPARLLNNAGIVGAALAARYHNKIKKKQG